MEMQAAAARLRRWVACDVAGHVLMPVTWRLRILRATGARIGPGATVHAGVTFKHCQRVSIGAHSRVNMQCYLDGDAPIVIGDFVNVGMRVVFLNGSHEIGTTRRRAGAKTNRPITIQDRAWVGAGATILPGITVGAGAVVAAGAVVTKDCEPDTLYVGVPARPVRVLPPLEDV